MITALISRLVILALGTLYPAYASYKAVRTKDVKEYIVIVIPVGGDRHHWLVTCTCGRLCVYHTVPEDDMLTLKTFADSNLRASDDDLHQQVKWMMYWIVFALFTCAETFTDVLFSFWFPFYYEIKVALVLWLLSPATKGSSFLYRNFVHPAFLKRESEIDEMLAKAKERGYSTVVSLGSKGVTYATNVILQTAMKGGGGLVEHIRKSYSLTDLGTTRKIDRFIRPDETDVGQVREEEDDEVPERPVLRRRPIGSPGIDMRFKEVDVNMRQLQASSGPLGDIQSTEDISSGYSSTDQLYVSPSELMLSRSSSVTRGRGRASRSAQQKKIPSTEGNEDGGQGSAVSSEPYPFPSESFDVTSIIRKFSSHLPNEDFPSKVKNSYHETPSSSFFDASSSMLSCDSQSSLNSDSSDKSERKGKYGKFQAPKPPNRDTLLFRENSRVPEMFGNPDQNVSFLNKFKPSIADIQSDTNNENSSGQTDPQKVLVYSKNEMSNENKGSISMISEKEKSFETMV